MIPKLTKLNNFLFQAITGILAAVFIVYGVLMIWDMYRTELQAFASYDLMKYRPNIEEDEPPYLDDLLKINPDTAGWITLYDTNIDYPIMQGKDDKEYLNKNVYGDFTISGSIFMASQNSKDFTDPYTLIYGHHMENGSMFGDVIKFKEKEYFDSHKIGVLILDEKVYDIKIMACVETDAYDHNFYYIHKSKDELPSFVEYCKNKGPYFRNAEYEKLIALSTCDSAVSFGRTILVCALTTRTDPLPAREYGKPIPHREPIGHPMAGAYWALLNLVILAINIYLAIRYILYRRNKITLLEIGLALISICVFIITEDLHKPIQIIDVWTPVMLIILSCSWFLIYHSEKKKKSN